MKNFNYVNCKSSCKWVLLMSVFYVCCSNLMTPHATLHNKPLAASSNGRTSCPEKVEKSRSPNLACITQSNEILTVVSRPNKLLLPSSFFFEQQTSFFALDLQISSESTVQQAASWLQKNSFENYVTTFTNFSGADLLRLTREDLIQICGLPDGIRLFYALHSK